MKKLAAVLVLAFIAALPVAAPAKAKTTAGTTGALSQTPPTCPASDPVVWVNTSSKIYWPQGTEYYGKTKHGGYACTSQAVAMGARAAKASPIKHSSMSGTTETPMPGASPGSKKKHKKTGEMTMPMATPTPG